ncbi:MAG: hypothetical protein IH914_10050 [candidate division Zixibacteria bacterium]|nr:hypothetical protein [candidate division Zixibacteria bacterium]
MNLENPQHNRLYLAFFKEFSNSPGFQLIQDQLGLVLFDECFVKAMEKCWEFICQEINLSKFQENQRLPKNVIKYVDRSFSRRLRRMKKRKTGNQSLIFVNKSQKEESIDQDNGVPYGATESFLNQLSKEAPDIVNQMDFEKAFFLYAIQTECTGREKDLLDAELSGNQHIIVSLKEELGLRAYATLKSQLLTAGGIHERVLSCGRKLRKSREYRHFPGGTLVALEKAMDSVALQLS